MTAAVTHVGLAAIGSASIVAHFGWLHGLTQGDGVGLVLFIYVLAIIVLRLAVLKNKNKKINIRTAPNVFRSPRQTHQSINTLLCLRFMSTEPWVRLWVSFLGLSTLIRQYIC